MPASSVERGDRAGRADCRILVFAKAAIPGRVKTRLIPALGAETAAALHEILLDHSLETARAASPNARVQLWCEPSRRHPFFQRYSQRFDLLSQPGGTLGDRMAHAFESALRSADRAIAIGCDCPALNPRHLGEAAALLKSGYDAVIAPAEDGGYVLLGLTRFSPVVFGRIAWGTETVLAQSRDRLASLGWRWHEMAPLWDIDRPEDYERMLDEGILPGWTQREIAYRRGLTQAGRGK